MDTTSINSWDDILALNTPTLIDFSDLHSMLLSEGSVWHLTGWTLDHDPAFDAEPITTLLEEENQSSDKMEIYGGLEINNVAFALLLDPNDGYRSYSSWALVLPNTALKTRIPHVPVVFKLSTISASGSDISSYDAQCENSLIDAISVDTNQVLLKMGTVGADDYPSAEFDCYVQHMHDAAPQAQKRVLEKVLSNRLSHQMNDTNSVVRKI